MSLPKFNIRVPLNIIVCSNLHPPNLGGSGANLYEGQQLGEQGYADHGEEGGDECDLGHEGGVALVFQAEHRAEGGHRHADEDGVDAVDGLVDAYEAEKEIHADGNGQQSEG